LRISKSIHEFRILEEKEKNTEKNFINLDQKSRPCSGGDNEVTPDPMEELDLKIKNLKKILMILNESLFKELQSKWMNMIENIADSNNDILLELEGELVNIQTAFK
jgi:hypothetical protein